MTETILIDDLYQLEWIEDPRVSPDGHWIAFVRVSIDRTQNKYRRAIWLATPEGVCKPFTAGTHQDHTPRWSPDGKTLAFVSTRQGDKPQIFLIPLEGGEAWQLTRMPNGATEPAWSPDGQHIAFLSRVHAEERAREDRGEIEEPPRDPWEAKRREEERTHAEEERRDPRVITRLPYRTGTSFLDDRYAHIYVLPTTREKNPPPPRRLTDGDVDYSAPVWSPNGPFILSSAIQDPALEALFLHKDLLQIHVETREITWLSQNDGFTNTQPVPSPDGRWIAYARIPDEHPLGWGARLAVMPAGGTTADAWDLSLPLDRAVELFRWAADSQSLYFIAEDRGNIPLFQVVLQDGQPEQILEGIRSIQTFDVPLHPASPSADFVAFVASTPADPSNLYLRTSQGEERQLTQVNADWLAEKTISMPEEIWYNTLDGQKIQGWIIKPPHFDPTQTYPLIVEIHGGPHTMWGPSTFSLWHEWQTLAAQDYVVFFCNPRGSTGYGHVFQDAIHDGYGSVDGPDILAGVEHVLKQGYVDPQRIGVTGGSYGGYMTTWLIAHSSRFAAAVSQRGVYNWFTLYGTSDAFELVETEFDGIPAQNAEKLLQHSPIAYAHQIQTPLLILHSELDYRVPISEAEQLFTLLRRLGRTVQFVRYPREGHELSRAGEPKHRVDRLQRMIHWFDRYCKLDSGNNARTTPQKLVTDG